MIQITSHSSPPTVAPMGAITFSGNGGPAVRYKVRLTAGGPGNDTLIDPPTGPNWSVNLTAPGVPGGYTFTVFAEKSEAEMGLTVSGS